MVRTSMLALALALSAGATRADDLSDLVDRYLAWRGGSAFEQLQTIHQRGKVEASGLHGTGDVWSSRDGRQRTDVDLGAFKQTQVTMPDPDQAWDTNVSGQIETTPTTIAQAQSHDLALQFADAFRGRGGVKVTRLGVEQRDGASWSVVRLDWGDSNTYDAFLDPATGALDGFRITEDRMTRFERWSDWRVVDGVRMAFDDELTTDAPGGNQSTRSETIELNRAFPDALVARPAAAHKASFGDGASSTGWIPFKLLSGNIFFPAKVNGHDMVVMLNSSTQASVIDKTVAQSVGLKSSGETSVMGSTGTETVGIINGVTVEVGDLELSDISVVSTDLRPFAQPLGRPLSFVLGDELFSEVAVDIDFANRRIAFRDPAHIARPQGAAEVPLKAVLGLRSLPVSVEGSPPMQFHFNLGGAGAALMVYPFYYEAHRLLDGRRTSQRLGSGGTPPSTVATLSKAELGGVTFTNVPTVFPPEIASSVTNTDRIFGAVGMPILSRFHLVVDYTHDRLWMTPEPRAANAPFAKDHMGLALLPKDGEIGFVSPGSPADQAGLKAGERIRLINHKPAAAWSHDALVALGEEAAGTPVDLTMADGKVRRLVLKDYF